MVLLNISIADGNAYIWAPKCGYCNGVGALTTSVVNACWRTRTAIPSVATCMTCSGYGINNLAFTVLNPPSSQPSAQPSSLPTVLPKPLIDTATLLHRYSFNQAGATHAVDSVGGEAWNGTLVNGAYIANGQVQLAGGASFQYVQLPANIMGSSSSVTLEIWFSSSATSVMYSRVFSFGPNAFGANADTNTIGVENSFNNNGKLMYFYVDSAGSAITRDTNTNFTGLSNMHLALVLRTNGPQNLYLNGVLAATFTVKQAFPPFTYNFIGASSHTLNACFMTGSIDEVRVWSTALAPYDILYHTVLGPGGECDN
jgi:Concanavalin A-like lectin/glucanases superfamily